jgi:hypothetical protein
MKTTLRKSRRLLVAPGHCAGFRTKRAVPALTPAAFVLRTPTGGGRVGRAEPAPSTGEEIVTVNPIQLQKYLGGVNYPANKRDLVQKAQANGADADTVKALQNIKAERFASPADVSEAMFKR